MKLRPCIQGVCGFTSFICNSKIYTYLTNNPWVYQRRNRISGAEYSPHEEDIAPPPKQAVASPRPAVVAPLPPKAGTFWPILDFHVIILSVRQKRGYVPKCIFFITSNFWDFSKNNTQNRSRQWKFLSLPEVSSSNEVKRLSKNHEKLVLLVELEASYLCI